MTQKNLRAEFYMNGDEYTRRDLENLTGLAGAMEWQATLQRLAAGCPDDVMSGHSFETEEGDLFAVYLSVEGVEPERHVYFRC